MNYLEEADEGTITLGGETIFEGGKAYGEKELRDKRLRFGLVFQSFNLFPQYNVLGNVTLALNLAKKEEIKSSALPRAEKKKLLRAAESDNEAYAMQIIERVGLKEKRKIIRANFRADSSNASRSPALWRLNLKFCALTSRPARSTPNLPAKYLK